MHSTAVVLLLALVLPLSSSRSSDDVPGRYAHCSVVFHDHMIVYGGRGFIRGGSTQQLATLGCARDQSMPLTN